MASSIIISAQYLSISGVKAVIVTEIVTAEEGYTRAVRFFGEPLVNGAPTLILDVTLTSSERAALEVSTPVLQF